MLADNFRVQSSIVNQTATQFTGSQNSSPSLPPDWTQPWEATLTFEVTPNSDDGVSIIFIAGLLTDTNAGQIAMIFAPGDFAANQMSGLNWTSNASTETATNLPWSAGLHTVSITFDGTTVVVAIDGTTALTSVNPPGAASALITYGVNNLTHTPMPQLHQVTVDH